jgi:DNA segregation ATPase FtsK/SpoIIIE, S-DNA-T family
MSGEVASNPFAAYRLDVPGDFQATWDVPSFGQDVTDRLLAEIEKVGDQRPSLVDRSIHVLLAPPGYGKTHIFGRIAHRLEHDALFVFVPAIEDTRRPLEHICWWMVEGLFRPPDNDRPPPLANALAGLCQASFAHYLSALPASLATRYKTLREEIAVDASAVLNLVASVRELVPFQRLANSIVARYPEHDAAIIRALALGWSPAHDPVRRWLRGESLSEEQARHLALPEEPPSAVDVLRAASTLLAGHGPVVLCLDQLDVLLADEQAPAQISGDLMILLGSIPNLLIVLSCLKVEWAMMEQRFNQAFLSRTQTHELRELSTEQALDLVRRRLSTWPGTRPPGGETSPFDETSLRAFLSSQPQVPRSLIQECRRKFESWLDGSDRKTLISLTQRESPRDALISFRQEWDRELDEIRRDPNRSPENTQEERIWRMIKEGLRHIKSHSGGELSALSPRAASENVVEQAKGKTTYRYSLEIRLMSPTGELSILVVIVKNPNKTAFASYFKAVLAAAEKRTVGVAWITPLESLPAGPAVSADLEEQRAKQRLRVLSLLAHRSDFERLQCYLTLLGRATEHELQLDGRSIDIDECRRLVLESAVLDHLGIFRQMLLGWCDPHETIIAPTTAPPAASTKSRSQVKPQTSTPPPLDQERKPRDAATQAGASLPASAASWSEGRLVWASERLDLILSRLGAFRLRVKGRQDQVQIGPTFARFVIAPIQDTSVTRVRNRAEDLKIALGVEIVPLINAQPDGISIDVQLPSEFRRNLSWRAIEPPPEDFGPLVPIVPVGEDVAGRTHWMNLAESNDCHLLVAGTTGSGKSEFLKVLVASLADRLGPRHVKFVLVDPKQVTFNFRGDSSPFLLRPVIHDPEDALAAVEECFAETERRFALLRECFVEDLSELQPGRHHAHPEAPPRIFLVFDEFADLMADKTWKKALEAPLKRIGAKARAAGIHIIMATQRPEATVVTPVLRSNLPGRIAFRVASKGDSKIILDEPDAADLLGRGDLLWRRGASLLRLQSPFISREELETILIPRE